MYCTIVTPDHVYKALALHRSIRSHHPEASTHVLTTSGELWPTAPGLVFHSLETIAASDTLVRAIADKYRADADPLRWSLKGAFMSYLLERHGDGVIYFDCDVCLFNTPEPLWSALNTGSVLLTPHWRPRDPETSLTNFRLNFLDGLYNAGCVGATSAGREALRWWSRACLSSCERAREKGLFFDQRYLDLLPIYFEQTVICRHRGCNVADWNRQLLREQRGGRVYVDGAPLIFVHFTANTIAGIVAGRDPVLSESLEQYHALLSEAKEDCSEPTDEAPDDGMSPELEEA